MYFDYGAHGTVVFLCKFASNMLISLLSSGKRCNGKDVAFISMMYFLFKHFWDTFWSMFVFHYILLIWTYTVHLMMVNVGFNIPVPWSIHAHPRYTNTLDHDGRERCGTTLSSSWQLSHWQAVSFRFDQWRPRSKDVHPSTRFHCLLTCSGKGPKYLRIIIYSYNIVVYNQKYTRVLRSYWMCLAQSQKKTCKTS